MLLLPHVPHSQPASLSPPHARRTRPHVQDREATARREPVCHVHVRERADDQDQDPSRAPGLDVSVSVLSRQRRRRRRRRRRAVILRSRSHVRRHWWR